MHRKKKVDSVRRRMHVEARKIAGTEFKETVKVLAIEENGLEITEYTSAEMNRERAIDKIMFHNRDFSRSELEDMIIKQCIMNKKKRKAMEENE